MTSAARASGAMARTSAPRARRESVSASAADWEKARSAPNAPRDPASEAVGLRQSTCVPRATGVASRFVGLHTPPSTYSRSAIRTGANTPGIEHDASTAWLTRVRGAPGAPKMTRRPLRRSTAAIRRRPSKRAPVSSTRRPSPGIRRPVRGTARSAAPRAPAPAGVADARAIGARGVATARPTRPSPVATRPRRPSSSAAAAQSRAARGSAPAPPALPGRVRRVGGGARLRARVGRPAGGEEGGHDRARGGADEVLALAEVDARGGAGAVEQPAHPRLTERPAHAEHEHVGALRQRLGHGLQARRRRGPHAPETARAGEPVCDNVRAYGGRHAVGLARPRAARGDGPLAAQPRRALRGFRADALAGRARRDEPDPHGRRAHRRRPRPPALPVAPPRRGRDRFGGAARRAPRARRRRAPLGGPPPAAAGPARRGALPHAPPRPPHRRPGRPADAR